MSTGTLKDLLFGRILRLASRIQVGQKQSRARGLLALNPLSGEDGNALLKRVGVEGLRSDSACTLTTEPVKPSPREKSERILRNHLREQCRERDSNPHGAFAPRDFKSRGAAFSDPSPGMEVRLYYPFLQAVSGGSPFCSVLAWFFLAPAVLSCLCHLFVTKMEAWRPGGTLALGHRGGRSRRSSFSNQRFKRAG